MLKIKHHYPKKILLISFECANWTNARSWPYNGFYAFEEALGNHAEVLTIPAIMGVPENDPCSWLGQAKRLTEGEQYDQAWIWVTHNDYSPEFLKWLQTKAPVQVGVIMESLAHTAFEETNYLHLKSRREKVLGHIRHCTHVLAFDDKDAHALQQEIKAKVFWCPPVVRWRDVNDKIDSPNPQPACFQGALYSQERQAYLKYEPLKKLLQRPKPLEDATDLPNLFDIHQAKGRHQLKHNQVELKHLKEFNSHVRNLRRQLNDLWQESLRQSFAQVNLPSIFKTYAGRVVESMAAGRPVISWRPPYARTQKLFVPGKEILWFEKNNPDELASQIKWLMENPEQANVIATYAKEKVLKYHTAEIRVSQILDWIKSGATPDYGETDHDHVDAYSIDRLDGIPDVLSSEVETTRREQVDRLAPFNYMEVSSLGSLTKLKKYSEKCNKEEAIEEFKSLLELRPFHPEAYLQLIEYSLSWKEDALACYLSKTLVGLTPEWELATRINKSFEHSSRDLKLESENQDLNSCTNGRRLSVCLIVKNEEPNIGRCLESVREIADQIVVVDTGSDDNTKTIAASHGAEVYEHKWKNDFSEARNKCLEFARGDWVLFLDADEELAPGSAQTLKEDMAKPNILGYRLPLENVGSPLHGCNYVPRLVRNAPGLHFIGKIHETIHASVLVVMRQWNMDQVMGKTKILHHGYKPEALKKKNKLQRNLALYEEALEELPDEPSIMMNYAHDLNHDGQTDKAHRIYKKILSIFEQHKKEHITPEVREQFIHNYGVFLAQHLKMKELSEVMYTRTARETGPVTNVHYMAGLGLMNCNKFREAIPELEASMEKAYDDTLAPCVPDVRTWKLKHLLANCHASVGDELKAIRLWEEVIAECDDSTDPYHDYARFLSTLERNKEALEILLKGLKVQGDTRKIWELGCGVVNKDPKLAEMSLEWTEEALKHHPDSDVTNVRRGESLMKNGRFSEAVEYFSRLSDRGEKTATAAQLVCRQLSDQAEEHDPEIARGFVNEVTGWIDVLDKAPCAFDRELAEQLIR